jgi:hypothetical protein
VRLYSEYHLVVIGFKYTVVYGSAEIDGAQCGNEWSCQDFGGRIWRICLIMFPFIVLISLGNVGKAVIGCARTNPGAQGYYTGLRVVVCVCIYCIRIAHLYLPAFRLANPLKNCLKCTCFNLPYKLPLLVLSKSWRENP